MNLVRGGDDALLVLQAVARPHLDHLDVWRQRPGSLRHVRILSRSLQRAALRLDFYQRLAARHDVARRVRTRVTRPAYGATTACSIFIAPSTASVCRSANVSPSRDVDLDERARHRRHERLRRATGLAMPHRRLYAQWLGLGERITVPWSKTSIIVATPREEVAAALAAGIQRQLRLCQ